MNVGGQFCLGCKFKSLILFIHSCSDDNTCSYEPSGQDWSAKAAEHTVVIVIVATRAEVLVIFVEFVGC